MRSVIQNPQWLSLPLGYSVLLGLCLLVGIANMDGWFFLLVGFSLVVATLQWCAMWTALGPGAYWKRTLVSLAIGCIVALGGGLAMAVHAIFSDFSEARELAVIATCCSPILWLTAQLPFGITRLAFGWQIAPKSQPARASSMSIQDMMIFTAFAALAFAGLQMMGFFLGGDWEAIELLGSIAAISAQLMVVGLFLSLPAIRLVLGAGGSSSGCSWFLAYVVLLFLGLAGLILWLSRGRAPAEVVFAIMSFLGSYALLFCLPLMFGRDAGLVLLSRRRIRTWSAEEPTEPLPDAPAAKGGDNETDAALHPLDDGGS